MAQHFRQPLTGCSCGAKYGYSARQLHSTFNEWFAWHVEQEKAMEQLQQAIGGGK